MLPFAYIDRARMSWRLVSAGELTIFKRSREHRASLERTHMNRTDEIDRTGVTLLARARTHPDNCKVSPEAARLAGFTGLIGRDIDTFIRFTRMHDLLIVARMPDFFAHAYVEELKRGQAKPKNASIKSKCDDYSTQTCDGRLYVSDIDLMCAHRFDRAKQTFVPLMFEWDGRRVMSPEENRYFGVLNMLLISKLQHGCNDNYVTSGRPNYINIGSEFIGFERGRTEVIYDVPGLRMYYRKHRLQNWHAAYGCA